MKFLQKFTHFTSNCFYNYCILYNYLEISNEFLVNWIAELIGRSWGTTWTFPVSFSYNPSVSVMLINFASNGYNQYRISYLDKSNVTFTFRDIADAVSTAIALGY